jgi:ferredoxin-NADP reductase
MHMGDKHQLEIIVRSGQKSETGQISREMPSADVEGNLRRSMFYISGSPTMVAAARRALIGAGANEENIRAETFTTAEKPSVGRDDD